MAFDRSSPLGALVSSFESCHPDQSGQYISANNKLHQKKAAPKKHLNCLVGNNLISILFWNHSR